MAIAGFTLAISSTSFDAGALTPAHAFVYDDRSALEADVFSSFNGGAADRGIPEGRATPRAPRYGCDHRSRVSALGPCANTPGEAVRETPRLLAR